MHSKTSNPKPIPAGSILLHIGPHKTGTSSLQSALISASSQLPIQGAEYVVAGTQRTANRAARSIQRLPYTGPRESPPIPLTVWQDLVNSTHRSPAERVIVSGEEFSDASPNTIKNIVGSFKQRQLHVAITLRSIDKVLLSQWQTDVKSAWTSEAFPAWLKKVLSDTRDQYGLGPFSRRHKFWYRHRHDLLVSRWAKIVGLEHIHIIVVKDYDPGFLFTSFERLLNLEPNTLSFSGMPKNISLDVEQIEVVRRLVYLLHRTVAGQKFLSHSKRLNLSEAVECAMPMLGARRLIGIPEWAIPEVYKISTAIVEAIQSHYDVVGHAEDLVMKHPVVDPIAKESFSESDLQVFATKAFNILLKTELELQPRIASNARLRLIQIIRLIRIAFQRIKGCWQ